MSFLQYENWKKNFFVRLNGAEKWEKGQVWAQTTYLFEFIFGCMGFGCCARASPAAASRDHSLTAVHKLLIAVVPLAAEHTPQAQAPQEVLHLGSVTKQMGSVPRGIAQSSRTRGRAHVPYAGRRILNQGSPGPKRFRNCRQKCQTY